MALISSATAAQGDLASMKGPGHATGCSGSSQGDGGVLHANARQIRRQRPGLDEHDEEDRQPASVGHGERKEYQGGGNCYP